MRFANIRNIVIPAKLAIASASRNPGADKVWVPAFAGTTGRSFVVVVRSRSVTK